MATEAGQDEEPAAGTSFSQPKENVDTHLTMAEQMHQMQQMMGAIMNKFQKWEAENDQTVAAESENESVGDIVPCNHTEGEFISPIFIRPKKDNRVRVILNLKKFNVNVENFHFKMETLKHALTLVSPNCFFCSLDLRDAYYSVHMTEKSQNFLKFEWKGQLYKYTAFPNGLACCPRCLPNCLSQ